MEESLKLTIICNQIILDVIHLWNDHGLGNINGKSHWGKPARGDTSSIHELKLVFSSFELAGSVDLCKHVGAVRLCVTQGGVSYELILLF